MEFAGARPYRPGDRRRDIDWRTTARHGELFVRQYAAERAFDLVLVLDTTVDAGEPGDSTLDLTVRAATGLAQTYLRSHDRVGLVTFGGPLRWLAPATGPRQLYRVSEALMSVRPDQSERDAGAVEYGLEHLPLRMLPPRAFVAVVTPLLDDRPLEAVRNLRSRGFSPLVVDVLIAEPEVGRRTQEQLALRAWRMQREALTVELGWLGVPVLPWDGEGDLTGALQHAMRAVRPGARSERDGRRRVGASGRAAGRCPWWVSPVGWRLLLVLAAGATLVVTALPDPVRPVVAAAVAAEAVVVLAAVTGLAGGRDRGPGPRDRSPCCSRPRSTTRTCGRSRSSPRPRCCSSSSRRWTARSRPGRPGPGRRGKAAARGGPSGSGPVAAGTSCCGRRRPGAFGPVVSALGAASSGLRRDRPARRTLGSAGRPRGRCCTGRPGGGHTCPSELSGPHRRNNRYLPGSRRGRSMKDSRSNRKNPMRRGAGPQPRRTS